MTTRRAPRRRRRLAILGIRPGSLAYLYWRRLRANSVQELLAGGGIAVGVALFLGVLVANANLTRAAGELIHGLSGGARVKIAARSSQGFDERLAERVGELPGVKVAVDLLRGDVALRGPAGKSQVQLVGASNDLPELGGLSARLSGGGEQLLSGGLALPSSVASQIGVHAGQDVTVLAGGYALQARVRVVLAGGAASTLQSSPVALGLISEAQRLTRRPGRVGEVLIEPEPGAGARVEAELRRIAGSGLEVTPADHELLLLEEAAKPNNAATRLFAAIGGLIGLLLTFNAMLLTAPGRLRALADLRIQGYDLRQVLLILCSQVLFLGLTASLLGVLLGEELSRTLFHQVPANLQVAFPVGTRETLDLGTAGLAAGCGLLASFLAAAPMVLSLRLRRAEDAAFDRLASEVMSTRTALALGAAGVVLVVGTSAALLASPGLTVAGGVTLGLAIPCLSAVVFLVVLRALDRLSERSRSSALILGVKELRGASIRAIAVASVAALAVFGAVAVPSAQHDLIHGLDRDARDFLGTAGIWVTPGGSDLMIDSFPADGAPQAVARVPGVASVRSFQGALLDVGSQRLWIIGRPAGDASLVPASQLRQGQLARADALLRGSGWASVSANLAESDHLRIGGPLRLPTPSGRAVLRVAAITTNLAWPPGAVIMSAGDFSHYWRSTEPTALEVNLAPGVSPAGARERIQAALAGRPGLEVQTFAERYREVTHTFQTGLASLTEIADMLLFTSALAIAMALATNLWQRRVRLAALKIHGYGRWPLWRELLLESAVVVGVGCAVGVVFGVYGHALADRWLRITTGFPAPFALGELQALLIVALIAGLALAVIALPGVAAARVSPRLSMQE